VSSARTLEGVGCDGRLAVHRGSPGRGSPPPSPLRPVPREGVRLAADNAGSPQGTRAGRPTRRGAPASSPARGRAAHARLTGTMPDPGERRPTPGASSRAGRRGPSIAGRPGASSPVPDVYALSRSARARASAAVPTPRLASRRTSHPRTARRGVSTFYRHGERAVGDPKAPRPCAASSRSDSTPQRRGSSPGSQAPSAGSQPAPGRDGLRRRSSGAR
jgi:hypothetical protein